MNPTIKARIESIRRGEVPEGYKRTKAGILPVDWEFNPLSQLAQKSKTKNREERYTKILTNSANEGIISQTDYFDKQIANNDNIEGYYIVKKGDFVYNPRISGAAPCGPINCYHGEETGVMSPLYTVFSIDVKKIERDYVEQFFSSTFWHRYMKSVANYGVRSDRMNLSDEDFFLLPIPMPMRTEQEKIAEILAGQDRVIALKEKLLAEKQKQKKYLMQQLLTGKKRLPGFSEKWKKYNFFMIFKVLSSQKYQIKKLKYFSVGKYPVIDQGKEFIAGYYNDEEKVFNCPKDGIIVFGDHTREIKFINFDFVVGADGTQLLVSSNESILTYFLYYLLLNMNIPNDGYSRHLKYIKEAFYLIPALKEQTAIAEILSTADKEIELLKKDIEQEKLKKKSLMQLLLTGIVRVKDV